jgi:hypothetical protein
MSQVERVSKHIPCQINDTTLEPIGYWQTFNDKINILGDHELFGAGISKSEEQFMKNSSFFREGR